MGGHDAELTLDMRLSFFSGHTSMSFYYATFLVIYMHVRLARLTPDGCMLAYQIAYSVIFALAALVGLSRIYDHKHHPSDVLVGMLVGIFLAVGVFHFSRHLFKEEEIADAETEKRACTAVVPNVASI